MCFSVHAIESMFPNCLLQSCATDESDHCPLLLGLNDVQPAKARFHFEAFWPSLDGFQEVVAAAWASEAVSHCPFDTLARKFRTLVRKLQSWGQKKVGHVNSQLALAREVLHQLEIAQDSRELSRLELWLKNKLKPHSLALSSLQRTIARSRSRIGWLKEGDANTSLFHAHARTTRGRISLLRSPRSRGQSSPNMRKRSSISLISITVCWAAVLTER